jgi:hypothetical protein
VRKVGAEKQLNGAYLHAKPSNSTPKVYHQIQISTKTYIYISYQAGKQASKQGLIQLACLPKIGFSACWLA